MIELLKEAGLVVAGLAAGYFAAYRQFGSRYYEDLQRESQEIRNDLEFRYEKKLERELEKLGSASEALKKYQGVTEEVKPTQETTTDNILQAEISSNKTDYRTGDLLVGNTQRELPKDDERTSKSIELIGFDDFVNNESGYKQFSITYFAGDDVLASESDQRIDHDVRLKTLGRDILQKLKDNSLGETNLHIRNNEQKVELEIVRSTGKYSVEVENKTG